LRDTNRTDARTKRYKFKYDQVKATNRNAEKYFLTSRLTGYASIFSFANSLRKPVDAQLLRLHVSVTGRHAVG
jgi:hypothetical protein